MDMFDENVVLCVSNSYEKKYYFNPDFDKLPDDVKNELKIMCVLFTEEVGGILDMEFDEEGNLLFKSSADEGDLLYDEIACGIDRKSARLNSSRYLLSRLPSSAGILF